MEVRADEPFESSADMGLSSGWKTDGDDEDKTGVEKTTGLGHV